MCKLWKAIYGLRQAPRAWYNELRTFLQATEFINSKCDVSLFVRRHSSQTMYLLVYVDDIIITGSSSAQVQDFIKVLAHRFSLKDLGTLTFFLGVEARHSASSLFLSQHKYTRDLLVDGNAPTDATQYRQILGSVQYLSLTGLDVSFAVNKLSQFMHRPTINHWNAVKRVLRYLKGSLNHGLFIRRS